MTAVSTTDYSAYLSDYINSQAAATSSSSTSSSSGLYSDYETFLQILVAQLQNQDPTEPTNVSEFTNQLVQYAEVEQQINTNDTLDDILSSLNSNGITPLLGYVGSYVETASEGKMVVQGGQSIMAYNLDESALSVKIEVKDGSGDVVATLNGTTDKGLNRLVWNGTCDDGTTAADGLYSFTLTALDNSGDEIEVDDVRIIGYVTGIETDEDGNVVLMAGDLAIDDEDVDAMWGAVGGYSNNSTSDTASSDTTETEETTS